MEHRKNYPATVPNHSGVLRVLWTAGGNRWGRILELAQASCPVNQKAPDRVCYSGTSSRLLLSTLRSRYESAVPQRDADPFICTDRHVLRLGLRADVSQSLRQGTDQVTSLSP